MKQDFDLPTSKIEDALQRVLKSEELAGANRLKSLLEYICAEQLAGRGDQILGKTIGMDVYGREPNPDGDFESIVRVDASRLRRRLNDYYVGSGSEDPLLISVPKGGYVPKFEKRPGFSSRDLTGFWAGATNKVANMGVPALVLGLVVTTSVALVLYYNLQQQPTLVSNAPKSDELISLLELSPSAVQARDLAKDGKVMVFPATEFERVRVAHSVFEEVMALDPQYYGGYAGAAQTTAILAVLADSPEEAQDYLARSIDLAETAFRIQPEAAWSLSAMAWTRFLQRDFASATHMSERATELSPGDPYIHGFDMIIAFFAGNFERAANSSSANIHQGQKDTQFNWRTAQANAQFHLGEYERAVKLHDEGIAHGEPPSEVNLAHVIASKQAAGDIEAAQLLAEAFSRTWPDSRLSMMLPRLFQNGEHAQAVLSLMLEAGWVDPLNVANPESVSDF